MSNWVVLRINRRLSMDAITSGPPDRPTGAHSGLALIPPCGGAETIQMLRRHCHIGQEEAIFELIWLDDNCPNALKYRHAA